MGKYKIKQLNQTYYREDNGLCEGFVSVLVIENHWNGFDSFQLYSVYCE